MQRLMGREVDNMADDSEPEMALNSSVDHESLWKGKYFTLLKHCRQIEQVIFYTRLNTEKYTRGTPYL